MLNRSRKVKAFGGLVSVLAVFSLALGTPAQAYGGKVPAGGKVCETTALAKINLTVHSGTKVFITDKNGVVLKSATAASLVIDAHLEVCVQVDVDALVEIGAALAVDADGDGKADLVNVPVAIVADLDGHADISVKIKGRVSVFLAVKVFAQADLNVALHKGEKYECNGGAKK